jgi:hypothetical protein
MAAGYTQTDVLSRVRREQRRHGKPVGFSGLRLVFAATAITVVILLFVFGAIGMLFVARTPHEPMTGRLDPAQPMVQQSEKPQAEPSLETAVSTHEKTLESDDIEKKAVKTLRVIAPAPPPVEQNDIVVQQPVPVPAPDPETTATVPPPRAQPQVPPRAVQHRQHQQRSVRRPVPDSQNDNPLFQLFGVKKYR